MDSFANAAAYSITFIVSATTSIMFSETPLSMLGLAFTSLVAGAIPFSEPPLKYTQLAYASGYLSGMILCVSVKTLKKMREEKPRQ